MKEGVSAKAVRGRSRSKAESGKRKAEKQWLKNEDWRLAIDEVGSSFCVSASLREIGSDFPLSGSVEKIVSVERILSRLTGSVAEQKSAADGI